MAAALLYWNQFPARKLFLASERSLFPCYVFFQLPLNRRRRSAYRICRIVPVDRSPILDELQRDKEHQRQENPHLIDVSGMVCGACASRVKSILCADDRVESAVVNMLTETAAVRLRKEALGMSVEAAEDLARRLTECGFPSKRKVVGITTEEPVSRWKEITARKEVLLSRSRNRVAFAWTLTALCCVSHASHFLHSIGIHVGHGSLVDILHNPYVKCAMAMLALLGPGRDLLQDGIRAFTKGSANMNSLVAFGIIAAFSISAVSLASLELGWDASFFDEPVMLLSFVLLGRSMEEQAALKASSDMNELISLASSHSRVVAATSESKTSNDNITGADDIYTQVSTDSVRVGDSVLVLPGETIPLDGTVVAGRSMVDESLLTGESLPVHKEKSSMVYAGTLNWDGPLRIEVSKIGSMSTVSTILQTVENAQGHETSIQRFADSIAGPLVYIIMISAAATFIFWYYIGTHIFPDVLLNDISGPEDSPLLLSFKLAVDVLVVSCPCALSLATPTAILAGTSVGARHGILIRGGDVLERLARIDTVALDETGILTEGKPTVTAVASLLHKELEILQVAAAVAKKASHPVAKAILDKAEYLRLQVPTARGQLTEPGFGTLAEVDGRLFAVGSVEWVHEHFPIATHSDIVNLRDHLIQITSDAVLSLNNARSVVYVGCENEGVIGAIAVSDTLRPDAISTVRRLQQMGKKVILLSGDKEEVVASIAKKVGIEMENVNAGLTPHEKSGIISCLQAERHQVAMVGDGIRDAPALAAADVGVAMQTSGKNTVASDTASVILLGNKVSQIVDTLDLSEATMLKVHQNLAWAITYNVIAIPIAAGLLLPHFEFAMSPSISGGLMALNSIFVVTNSLLLQLHIL